MADNLRFQSSPSAAVMTDLYTVPASRKATLTSFVACNYSATEEKIRVEVAPAGAASAASQRQWWDLAVPPNDSFVATIGITMTATDVLRVYSLNGGVAFSIYGYESGA